MRGYCFKIDLGKIRSANPIIDALASLDPGETATIRFIRVVGHDLGAYIITFDTPQRLEGDYVEMLY